MTLNSAGEDYVKKAVELREAGRLDEAMLAARRATTVAADDANAWWQLALTTWEREGAAAAIPHLKKTVALSSRFAYGWHRLGNAYKVSAMRDQAIDCWQHAVEVDADRADSWHQLADAYRDRDVAGDEDRQFAALQELERLGKIEDALWNRLGNGYAARLQQQRAIQCYQRYAAIDGGYAAYYNLGLSFNSLQVQQRTDAIDAWRRAELADPEKEGATAWLKTCLPRAMDLRRRVLADHRVILEQRQWYTTFVSPYELLALMGEEDLESLDAKAIQQAKKRVLQEIELEDGVLAWMPGLVIDRSRAIKIADELMDERLADYQRVVAGNRELCGFLSRGELAWFLVDPAQSPIDLLEIFEADYWEFPAWLSERFATQYDLVLTTALEAGDVNASEALLGGRRLVRPEHQERCFEGAQRQVDRMLVPLREAAARAERTKPTAATINAVLQRDSLDKIFALLPQHFQEVQNELVALIRSISIDAHNRHDDTDLAMAILTIGKGLAARSPALLQQIEEDEQALARMLADKSKHDASLQSRGETYSITRKEVVFGARKMLVQDVRKVRFGIVNKRDGNARTIEFNLDVVSRNETRLSLAWTATRDLETQQKLFKSLQDAAYHYLMPPIIQAIEQDLAQGRHVRIGPALCTQQGIEFDVSGWFSSKKVVCHWRSLKAELDNGQLTVADPRERNARLEMPLASTDNAFALFLLINKFQQ